jgi:hypothetical protein
LSTEFAFLDDDEEFSHIGATFQPKVYVVMRVSPKMGGTYSEIRKSYNGVKSLLIFWDSIGLDMRNVRVYPLEKEWIPIRKTKEKKNKGELTK